MADNLQTEVWQRGPVENIPPLLQPVAHALLQATAELKLIMSAFPDNLVWERPYRMASPAFHLQHLSGVLDRVFTYARGEALSPQQLEQLYAEDLPMQAGLTVQTLLDRFNRQVDIALAQLSTTDEKTLIDSRGVGRKLLPSTVIGLLVHGAEHTMRHIGQLMVTVRIIHHNAPTG